MNNCPNPVESALIVDDNRFNREIFRIALDSASYQTTEASNGAEAIALLETKAFHLAVLDLQMPFVDGVTVLKTLRLSPLNAKMIVIVATANPHMATAEVHSLADYVLNKPIDIQEFARLVKRLKQGAHATPRDQRPPQ